MRIVIDMQGAQSSANWNRGIGRYTMSLALALVHNRGDHEIFLVLNSSFPASVERIRAKFEALLPPDNIRVWNAPSPMAHIDPRNEWRRHSGEIVREAFLASLHPDFTIISSLFEGLNDDAVTSLKRYSDEYLTAVILYDLIPLIHRRPYLENPAVEQWYLEKIEYLRRADLWLAISESSKQEGLEHLGLPTRRCINISTCADEHFRKISLTTEAERGLRKKYGLARSFVMYTGGIDHRKNVEGLILAYGRLSPGLRTTHQLAIVCSVQDDSRRKLMDLATHEGMNADDVVFTGFVPEEDLVALYSLCAVFVFPSWHEGFGLPALEAMRCGAPVIASNTSSLPEVVGLSEALFDPHSRGAITNAIERALTDQEFRAQLIAHGLIQASKFSWNETARRTIDAMSQAHAERAVKNRNSIARCARPLMAYVSPLPPERSGISDYSAELLPALAKHYDIEVVVAQEAVTDEWTATNCTIRSPQWFIENSARFDRVIYHFGASSFHQHMFELLRTVPGVVVLHDFFLSGVIHYMDALGYAPKFFSDQLYRSHGFAGLLDYAQAKDVADVIWKYPCSLDVIESSVGVIFHSEYSLRLMDQWYGEVAQSSSVIPLLRAQTKSNGVAVARRALGFSDSDFLACSFGILGPSKLNHRLLNAWLNSDLAKVNGCHLVFVGENQKNEYGDSLRSLIEQHPNGASVQITGWTDQETFRMYLNAADIGVQLRALSRGETSAAVLDCMNHGLATIVNANGSMADLADGAVLKLTDDFDDQDLILALETLWRDQGLRSQIGAKGQGVILESHDPTKCAKLYETAIEISYAKNRLSLNGLIDAIGEISTVDTGDSELIGLADSIARTFPSDRTKRVLLVDISELVQRDAKSGIQRVVRNVLQHWLLDPPAGWRVEPVYATVTEPYRYARQFTTAFLNIPDVGLIDEPIEFAPGDVFFALDFQPHVQIAKADFYQLLRNNGVTVKFQVYDLLCLLQPQHFVPGAEETISTWLQVVGEGDGAICISQSVSEELHDWMSRRTWKRLRQFRLESNLLGADFNDSSNNLGIPAEATHVLKTLRQCPTFLMVGTLEPRKGHAQTLDAFEYLWRSGVDINLVVVGKQGWMVEDFVERLRKHSERCNRLFWLEGISDEYLESIYSASTALIAASYGEGFGLPLIEAGQHRLPIIARDIPVFREVAGANAFYFSAGTPIELKDALDAWLNMYKLNTHPRVENLKWLTWKESSTNLIKLLCH